MQNEVVKAMLLQLVNISLVYHNDEKHITISHMKSQFDSESY
jgi:hypothetical protein